MTQYKRNLIDCITGEVIGEMETPPVENKDIDVRPVLISDENSSK